MQQGTFMRWFLTWFVVWLLAAVVLLCLGAGIRAAAATGMAQGACATEPRFAAPSVLKLIHHSDAASRIILRVVLKPVVLWFAPAPADAVAAEEASGTARDPSYCVLLALCIDLVNGIDHEARLIEGYVFRALAREQLFGVRGQLEPFRLPACDLLLVLLMLCVCGPCGIQKVDAMISR